MEIDWMQCELVESVEGRCGGQPTVIGTRIFPQPIVDDFEDGETIESLQAEAWPSLSRPQIERLIEFAREQRLREAA